MLYKENTLTYAEYCALRLSVNWTNFDEAQTKIALARGLYSVTAVENGQPVGMARLVGDGVYDMVVDVLVRPDCQGRGIGSELVRRLLQFAEHGTAPGGHTIVLLAAEPGKEPFYTKLGFHAIPAGGCGAGMMKIFRK